MIQSRLLLFTAALLVACISLSNGAVIGIDFGSEFIKVASVKPGTPFHIVIDEQSKRKIPAVVAFDEGERYFGNDGLGFAVRKPKNTYQSIHRLLGKTMDSPQVAQFRQYGFPYDFVELPDRGGAVGIRHDDNTTFSPEELLAMSLQHIKRISEADAGSPIKDCVLTVPSFFSQAERQAMLDAAHLAGLNVLSLINENTAAAVQYGIDRKYQWNETHTALIYNMGSTSTQVSLVVYSGYNVKPNKKQNKTIGQMEVKGLGFDESLGGNAFDLRLVDFFSTEFNKMLAKTGDKTDCRTVPRVMAKLRKSANEVKTVLSANMDTPVNMVGVMNDLDFRTTMSREKFYELSADLLDRVTLPIQSILDEKGLSPSDVDAVLIIGGSTRIPAVQKRIKEFFNREALDMNLNADEAAAMGAVFRAANLSTAFQVRPFGLIDVTPYPIAVRIQDLPVEGEEQPEEAFSKRAPLFKRYNRLAKRKAVAFSHTRDITCLMTHDQPELLPKTVSAPISVYNVTGISAMMANPKYAHLIPTQKPRVSLSFGLDSSGLVDLVKVEATLEEMIKVPIVKKVNATTVNATETTDSTTAESDSGEAAKEAEGAAEAEAEPAAAEADEDDSAATEEQEKAESAAESTEAAAKEEGEAEPEFKLKKKTYRVALRVSQGPASEGVQPLDKQQHKASAAVLARLTAFDDHRKEIAVAKNSLESYIYGTRSRLEEDEIIDVSTEEQREELSAKCGEAENWLYDQGTSTEASEYKAQLAGLTALFAPIELRFTENTARPDAVNTTEAMCNYTRSIVAKLEKERPWIPAEERSELLSMVEEVEAWLATKQEEQSAKAAHEAPAFTSTELLDQLRPIARLSQQLLRRVKPKETVKPKLKKTTANTSSASSESAAQDEPASTDKTESGAEQDEAQEKQDASTEEQHSEAPAEKDEL